MHNALFNEGHWGLITEEEKISRGLKIAIEKLRPGVFTRKVQLWCLPRLCGKNGPSQGSYKAPIIVIYAKWTVFGAHTCISNVCVSKKNETTAVSRLGSSGLYISLRLIYASGLRSAPAICCLSTYIGNTLKVLLSRSAPLRESYAQDAKMRSKEHIG